MQQITNGSATTETQMPNPFGMARVGRALVKRELRFPGKHSSCSTGRGFAPANTFSRRFGGPWPVFWGEDSRGRGELGAGDLATHCARCAPNPGVVPDALVLSGIAAGHHVESVVFFAEPDRGRDGLAVPAKSNQGDIFLAANLGRMDMPTLDADPAENGAISRPCYSS